MCLSQPEPKRGPKTRTLQTVPEGLMCTWSQLYASSSVDQRVTEDGYCCCREAVFIGTGCAPTVSVCG